MTLNSIKQEKTICSTSDAPHFRANQTHYEQMGFMKGTLKVDGKEVPLKLDGFRDHSGGKCDLRSYGN